MNTTTDKDLLALARTILEGTSINEAREYEPEENAKVCQLKHYAFIAYVIATMATGPLKTKMISIFDHAFKFDSPTFSSFRFKEAAEKSYQETVDMTMHRR